jgi:serine/threonine protein kinase
MASDRETWSEYSSLRRASPVAGSSPAQIGKYEVVYFLGEGSFGRVFLAYDPDANRRVAIKVPKRVT